MVNQPVNEFTIGLLSGNITGITIWGKKNRATCGQTGYSRVSLYTDTTPAYRTTRRAAGHLSLASGSG